MEKQPEYVSLGILKSNYTEWKKYLRTHKIGLSLVFCVIFSISIAASFFIRPQYTATLSFAMQSEDSGSGGIADIASSFGFSLGGSSSGAFGGDNLFELLVSQFMVEKALLRPDTIDDQPTNLLNHFIKVSGMQKSWDELEKENPLHHLNYPLHQNRETFSRMQDSVLKNITGFILKKELTVAKRSKKLSIGDITFISENETFSKHFVENLMTEAGAYYIQTKTKRSRESYERLEHEADSIKRLYVIALGARASAADVIPNSIRQVSSVGVLQKTTEVQLLATTYAELRKNLEMARLSMGTNTPLIEVIDKPRYPLSRSRFGLLKATAVGIVGGAFMAIVVYSLLFVKSIRRKDEEEAEPFGQVTAEIDA